MAVFLLLSHNVWLTLNQKNHCLRLAYKRKESFLPKFMKNSFCIDFLHPFQAISFHFISLQFNFNPLFLRFRGLQFVKIIVNVSVFSSYAVPIVTPWKTEKPQENLQSNQQSKPRLTTGNEQMLNAEYSKTPLNAVDTFQQYYNTVGIFILDRLTKGR